MIVRELITRLGFQVDKRGAQQYEHTLDTLHGMAMTFVGILSVRQLADMADAMQGLEARIAQLPQTVDSAAQSFNDVSAAATEARQPLREFGNLYVRLANATRELLPEQQEVLNLTSTIAKTFVIGSLTAQEQASAMLQLSQAFNKGKLDGDEFRAVMEAMPGQITRALAKNMGYDTLALFYKAREDGELTVDKLIKAFQMMREDIDSQFKAMPLTISQGLNIVSNRFSTFVQRLNRESGAVTAIAETIIAMFDAVESGMDKMSEAVGGSMNVLKSIAGALMLVFGNRVIGAIVTGAGFIVKALTPIKMLFAAILLGGEDFYTWIKGGKSAFAEVAGTYDEFTNKYKNIASAVNSIGDAFSWVQEKGKAFFSWMKEALNIGDGTLISNMRREFEATAVVLDRALSDNKKPEQTLTLGSPWKVAGDYLASLFGGQKIPPQTAMPAYQRGDTNNTTINVYGVDTNNADSVAREIGKKAKLQGVPTPFPNYGGTAK